MKDTQFGRNALNIPINTLPSNEIFMASNSQKKVEVDNHDDLLSSGIELMVFKASLKR